MRKDCEFLDKYIWIYCGKFSVLWKEYLSSAFSVLANSPKISATTKSDVFWLNFLRVLKQKGKRVVVQISVVFETV